LGDVAGSGRFAAIVEHCEDAILSLSLIKWPLLIAAA
jgi:hypothetical protein